MTKTFITAISLQGKGELRKPKYTPQGFELKKNLETSFPIIPIVASEVEEADDIKVIALRTENADANDNYQIFLEQLKQVGVDADKVAEVTCEENQSQDIGIKALLQIIDEIPEDSIVYADITFGTKPMSIYILFSCIFVEKMKDVEVVSISYGEIPRENNVPQYDKAKLYNLAVLKDLGNLIDSLKLLEVNDIRTSLEKLIEM